MENLKFLILKINDIFIGSDFSHQDVHDLFLKVTDDSGDSRILVELRKFAKNVVNHTAVAHCLDFPGPRCVKSDVAVQTELVMDDLKYFDREMSDYEIDDNILACNSTNDYANVSDSSSDENGDLCTEVYVQNNSEPIYDEYRFGSTVPEVCRCASDSTTPASTHKSPKKAKQKKPDRVPTAYDPQLFLKSPSLSHLNNQNVQTHIFHLNQEIHALNFRVQNLLMTGTSPQQPPQYSDESEDVSYVSKKEHIYETLPDDDEPTDLDQSHPVPMPTECFPLKGVSSSQSVPVSLSLTAWPTTAPPTAAPSNFLTKSQSQSAATTLEASKTVLENIVNLEKTILGDNGCSTVESKSSESSQGAFIAPNLGQYKFVNGQQIYRSSHIPDDAMLKWKVKRRQDGTKYIVQRPYASITKKSLQLTSDDDVASLKEARRHERSKVRRHHRHKSHDNPAAPNS